MILIQGCISTPETPKPPAVPKMHLHNPDIPDDEWGPDALTDTNGIHIEWDANEGENLAGYKIYRSTNPGSNYELLATLSKESLSYEDEEVQLEKRYYYRLSAFDKDGNESGMSETASYTLLSKPIPTAPLDQADIDTLSPTFSWIEISGAQAYIVHVFVKVNTSWQKIWTSQEKFSFDLLEISYNEDNSAIRPLEEGKQYRWRVDAIGGVTVGSESTWQHFSVEL